MPVLIISGTLDARTPVSNAGEYLTGFKNGTHMIIEGAVHSDPLFLSSPKIKDGMMEFLRGAACDSDQDLDTSQIRIAVKAVHRLHRLFFV